MSPDNGSPPAEWVAFLHDLYYPKRLILSKAERNSPKDREDVQYLAKTAQLNPTVLRERYDKELRANEARHDLTIKLWSELFPPASANRS